MPYSEAASEATIAPVVNELHNADSKQASEKALASLENANPNNDPKILKEQSEALVTAGVMPEMILLMDTNEDSVIDGADISEEGSLMRYLGNGDDLIGLDNANEMESLDTIINTGQIQVDGITVDFTYDQRLVAAAVRDNIPALDTLGSSGGDMIVGVADYEGMAHGEHRDLADESLMGSEAFITNFSEPGSFVSIFGTETASRDQVEDAVQNPQNHPEMTASQWRGLGYALERFDDVSRSSQYLGYTVDDPTAPLDYVDAKAMAEARRMDDQAMSAASERQSRIDENSHDFKDAWEVGRDAEPETPDDVVRTDTAEESHDEPVPEKSAASEESHDESVPETSNPAEENHTPASAEDNADKQAEPAESGTTKYPMTGDTLTDPEKLKSGAFVTRDAEGRPTTVYGVNGEEASYEYDETELKTVKLAGRDGNAKVFTRTEDGWEERGMSGSAVYNSKVDEVSIDKTTGNITATTDGKQTVYDLGLSEAANKDALTQDMAAKQKEATAAKQKEEVAALEANLGRDVTVLSNGDLQFEIVDGDTLFEIRNDVAKSIKVEEISLENGMQIYDDQLVLSIAKENGIADIDVIRPGKVMVIPRDMLDQYMAS